MHRFAADRTIPGQLSMVTPCIDDMKCQIAYFSSQRCRLMW
jgi:hypothetical protein